MIESLLVLSHISINFFAYVALLYIGFFRSWAGLRDFHVWIGAGTGDKKGQSQG